MYMKFKERNKSTSLFRVISFAIFCFIMGIFTTGCYTNCDVNIDYCGYNSSIERNNDPAHQDVNFTKTYKRTRKKIVCA